MSKQKVLNEGIIIHVIFALLFVYVILRAVLVFYVNDEIMTKNGYMIDWNFLPYTGYIDANNHFVLSFLGGLFYRIFNSESIWIIRLPSILAFPLFYYSLVGFRRYLKSNWSVLFLIISVCCTSFFLEFFSIARGYGLSFSFMTFAFLQTAIFFENVNSKNVGWATFGWLLAIYTNLSLLPLALFGILFLLAFSLQKKQKWGKVFTILSLLPFTLAVKYSLDLQKAGKLYLGAESDFYITTIHSLTELMWNSGSTWLDVLLSVVFLLLSVHLFYRVIQSKNLFEHKILFQIFLFVGIVGILLQNLVFGIFYPENRAAAYLVFLFYGSLAFIIDQFSQRWLYVPITVVTLFFFWVNLNFTHTMIYYYEHVDKELFSLIPDEVNGMPPATGARFWQLDDEITKQEGYPVRAFQLARSEGDTLFDYIIQLDELRPKIRVLYNELHVDTISKLTLFERKNFLKRNKINEFNVNFDGKEVCYYLMPNQKISPIYIRCSGVYYDISPSKTFPIIFSVEDSVNHEGYSYGGFEPFTSSKIGKDKTIKFDFLYTINEIPSSAILKTYIFNPREEMIKGELKIEVYEIVGYTNGHKSIENEL